MAGLRLLLKHQAGAFVSTAVDFATMTALVEAGVAAPEPATAAGAAMGAICNFALGRRWIFAAHQSRLGPQALRYAFVSFVSLLLNTAGEGLLFRWVGMEYRVARVLVSVAVSLLWNFPMHRRFVFKLPGTPEPP